MSTLLNPNYKPHLSLVADQATWDALKLVVTNYLDANAGSSEVNSIAVRALDPQLADDSIWAQISSDMQLFGVESHE